MWFTGRASGGILNRGLLRGRDFYLGKKRMKNRKRMGGQIKGRRERGEWAEMYFMMLALERDMKVSRPFGLGGDMT